MKTIFGRIFSRKIPCFSLNTSEEGAERGKIKILSHFHISNTLNSFLTFDQIQNLTTRTPFCGNFGKDDDEECHFCNITVLDDCGALTSFEEIYECTSREGSAVCT